MDLKRSTPSQPQWKLGHISTKMKCTHESCGAKIPAGARFCTGCGTEVQSPVPVKTTLCPSCNDIVVIGCKFCQSCGGKIDPALFIDKICHGTKDNGQKCNTVLTSGTKFCTSCGTLQDTSNTHDTSNTVVLPGDAPLKLDLQTTQQKGDNQDNTTPPIKEEHGSSGSCSPDLWEAPTIPLASNANKTEPVKESVQQIGSQMNPAQIELNVPMNATDVQDMKTLETGKDCAPKIDNEGLKLTNQQSGVPQGGGQASPGLLDQQTGEPQNNCHTSLVKEESPRLTDQQTGELQSSTFSSPVDNDSPVLPDQVIDKPHSNEPIGPDDKVGTGMGGHESDGSQGHEDTRTVDKESPNLEDKKTVEPEDNGLSGPNDNGDQGLTDKKSSELQESDITNMETQIAGPLSNPNNSHDSNGNQNSEKPNNFAETDDQNTKLQGDESKHNESNRNKQELKEKEFTQIKERQPGDMRSLSNLHRSGIKRSSGTDLGLVANIIENPSNRDVHKPETNDDTTDTELQVILISDTESVDDGQGTNEELVNTNVKPTKRKLVEEEVQMKKIKGEDNECDKGIQHENPQSIEKHGIQETGEQGSTDGNTGQLGASTAEQKKNTKEENKQVSSNDTEKTNEKQTDNQVVKQGEDKDEEKGLKENSNQKEDQLPTKRITRSMQANKNEHQSNQTQV
ncbi:protein IWS1 homolog [Mytilus trossulus]|uniref:protein IWS1 homolog n=1 Tax=Mytilus trossulus TaxID=6551 RepID=UPI0030045841